MNIGKRVGGINLFSLHGPPYSSSSGLNKFEYLLRKYQLALFVRRAFEGRQSTNEHSIF
jgi:hypothetical protein